MPYITFCFQCLVIINHYLSIHYCFFFIISYWLYGLAFLRTFGNMHSWIIRILEKKMCFWIINKWQKNETKRNEINENETKRNEINKNETKRNETKSTKWKRNKTKPTKGKRNQRKQNEIENGRKIIGA
jgi:hypothetical protein